MKLSLSGRLFESAGKYTLALEEMLRFARQTGFDGVEIRYPQLPMETPKQRLGDVAKQLKDLGLTWVFGTVEGISDEKIFERSLRTMDNNLSCGCQFTRISVSKPEHIAWAQRFADEAAKRRANLVMQLHANTLPDNVPHTLDTFAKLNRPNIGLAFEANHLTFDGNKRHADAVHQLAKHIVLVSVQNYKPAPDGASHSFKVNGKTYARALPGDPEATDFPSMFQALKTIGFQSFVTVMTDAIPGMDSRDLSKRYQEYLSGLIR